MAIRTTDYPDRAALVERMRRHRVLGQLDHAELERLIVTAQPRTLAARSRLFSMGEAGNAVYLVWTGWIKLAREGPKGRDVLLEVAGAGTLFGELAVICSAPRATDAVALTAARVLAIDGRNLLAVLRRSPEALLGLVRMLGERMAHTTSQMEDSLFLPADARLARALTRLAARAVTPDGGCLSINVGLSQRELGDMTGLSRESINKQIAAWRDAGVVDMNGHTVRLIDGAALSEIAEAARD